MQGSGHLRAAAAPPWSAGFCGVCGALFAPNGWPCPRCRAAPRELSWTEDVSGRPQTRAEWVGAAITCLWLTALIVGLTGVLVFLAVRGWTTPNWSGTLALGLVIACALVSALLWIAVDAMRTGLRPLLWRRWRYRDRSDDLRGSVASLAGIWFRGEGTAIVRDRLVAVPRDIPSTTEIEAVGAGAAARTLAAAIRPGGAALTPIHARVIAAALLLAAREAVRLSLVQRRSWRRTGPGARVAWEPPADRDLALYVEVMTSDAPADTLEAHLLAALGSVRSVAESDLSGRTGRREAGDPYREAAPLEASGGRILLEVGFRLILDRLAGPATSGGDAPRAATLAGRLAAPLTADAELTDRLLGIADRVEERRRLTGASA